MEEEEKAIQNYINEKQELQKLVLQILENSDDDDTEFQNLYNYLDTHQIEGNKSELEHFLHLVLEIANNHHRESNFLNKIEKILIISSKFYKPVISNKELFEIFKQSKWILLSLFKAKIITIDKIIFNYLFTETRDNEISYYFYPEINSIIKTGEIEGINDQKYQILKEEEDKEKFELNRQKGENESKLCSIIREDLIDDFIRYINETNISLKSQIKRSLFETNSMFIEKEPTLIEYATFFGSIQVLKYLAIGNVELTPSLWLYAVHSNNPEVIQFLEDKQIKIDNRAFSECVKCHHNDIAHYIYDNYYKDISKFSDLNENTISSVYSSNNYEFFPDKFEGNEIFFYLCKNGYTEIVNHYLTIHKNEIDNYLKNIKNQQIKQKINRALIDNRLDAVYYLLLDENCTKVKKFFQKSNSLHKIALPPTIKSINADAFTECISLVQISIPSSVTEISHCAFDGCKSLVEITIPSSVTKIGNYAFSNCKSLIQISIPSSVTEFGDGLFSRCSSLTQVSIPSLTEIKYSFFYECKSLAKFSIQPSVTKIGKRAFSDCSSLEQISISSFVTEIEDYAFFECTSLKSVSLPLVLSKIGKETFKNCRLLRSVTIPSSISEIGDCCFSNCPLINEFSIIQCNEKRLEYFEDKFLVFKSDPASEIYDTLVWAKFNFTTMNIPSFIKTIYSEVFSNQKSLIQISIPSSVCSLGYCIFKGCESLEQITIPHSVTIIGGQSFWHCSSLKQIIIPSSVSIIDSFAFQCCTSLTQVVFESSLNIKIFKHGIFKGCTSLKQITIPASVTAIETSSFKNCTSLEQITIPSLVTTIGEEVFKGCTSLTQITFESPSHLSSIGEQTFKKCTLLKEISIPESVTSIGKGAFDECTSLIKITIPSSIKINNLMIPSKAEIITL